MTFAMGVSPSCGKMNVSSIHFAFLYVLISVEFAKIVPACAVRAETAQRVFGFYRSATRRRGPKPSDQESP